MGRCEWNTCFLSPFLPSPSQPSKYIPDPPLTTSITAWSSGPASPFAGLLQTPLSPFLTPSCQPSSWRGPMSSHQIIHSSAQNPPVVPITFTNKSKFFHVLPPGFLVTSSPLRTAWLALLRPAAPLLFVRQTGCESVVLGSTFQNSHRAQFITFISSCSDVASLGKAPRIPLSTVTPSFAHAGLGFCIVLSIAWCIVYAFPHSLSASSSKFQDQGPCWFCPALRGVFWASLVAQW